MEERSSVLPQIIAAIGATLGAFSLGTVICWPAVAQPFLDVGACNTTEGYQCDEELTTDQWSQVAALMNVGAAIFPLCAMFAIPAIGKKWTMIGLAFPFIAGWIIIIFANSPALFYLGRLVTGFSGGAFALAAPAYTGEIAEPRIRGALGSLMQLMVCLGILFVYVFGLFLDWKVLTGINIIFPALMTIWMFFMPRSPVFLMEKGLSKEAEKALQFFRKKKDVSAELRELQEEITQRKKNGTVSAKAIFTRPEYLKPFLLSLGNMLFQQATGINFVMSYTVNIFQAAKSPIDPNISAIMIGGIQVLGTGIAITIVDRFGRKILLTVSAAFMCLSLAAMGTYFQLDELVEKGNVTDLTTTVATTLATSTVASASATTVGAAGFITQETMDNLSFLPVVSLLMYVAAFAIGFGPIPWVMNVELFPKEARPITSALCTTFNWMCSYLVVSLTPSLQVAAGYAVCYYLFSGVALLAVLFVTLILPETKGKSEEDMRKYFRGTRDD